MDLLAQIQTNFEPQRAQGILGTICLITMLIGITSLGWTLARATFFEAEIKETGRSAIAALVTIILPILFKILIPIMVGDEPTPKQQTETTEIKKVEEAPNWGKEQPITPFGESKSEKTKEEPKKSPTNFIPWALLAIGGGIVLTSKIRKWKKNSNSITEKPTKIQLNVPKEEETEAKKLGIKKEWSKWVWIGTEETLPIAAQKWLPTTPTQQNAQRTLTD